MYGGSDGERELDRVVPRFTHTLLDYLPVPDDLTGVMRALAPGTAPALDDRRGVLLVVVIGMPLLFALLCAVSRSAFALDADAMDPNAAGSVPATPTGPVRWRFERRGSKGRPADDGDVAAIDLLRHADPMREWIRKRHAPRPAKPKSKWGPPRRWPKK